MATALKPVNAHRVTTDTLSLQRVAHGCAFVNDLDARFFHRRQISFRRTTGGFHNLHATFDDRLDIARIVRRGKARQEGQVHTERLVGHLTATRDLFRQIFRRALGKTGDNAEPARIRHRRRHFSKTDKVHATLDHRMFNLKKFCNACFHKPLLQFCPAQEGGASSDTIHCWRGLWSKGPASASPSHASGLYIDEEVFAHKRTQRQSINAAAAPKRPTSDIRPPAGRQKPARRARHPVYSHR